MKKLAFIASTLLFVGCFGNKAVVSSELNQADADRGQAKFAGLTLAQLNEGKSLYENHCGNCHGLKTLTAFSEEEWRRIVPGMTKKVNKKEGDVLDASKEELILKYVVTMATK